MTCIFGAPIRGLKPLAGRKRWLLTTTLPPVTWSGQLADRWSPLPPKQRPSSKAASSRTPTEGPRASTATATRPALSTTSFTRTGKSRVSEAVKSEIIEIVQLKDHASNFTAELSPVLNSHVPFLSIPAFFVRALCMVTMHLFVSPGLPAQIAPIFSSDQQVCSGLGPACFHRSRKSVQHHQPAVSI